jgi:hypothetical protein
VLSEDASGADAAFKKRLGMASGGLDVVMDGLASWLSFKVIISDSTFAVGGEINS